MTRVGKLNVDVTATTTKFDAAMTRVRNGMRQFGAAGTAGGALGGGSLPVMGAVGGFAGLSGPLMAVGAGIGVLTGVIRESNRLAEANLRTAERSDLAGISDREGAVRRQLGNLIDGGGVSTVTDLMRQFQLGGQFQGMLGINADQMSTVEFLEALAKVAKQSNADELVRLGMLPRAALALRSIDPAQLRETASNAPASLSNARRFQEMTRDMIASGVDDPGFFNSPLGATARTIRAGNVREFSENSFFSMTGPGLLLNLYNRALDALEQTRDNTATQGPGL